MNTTEPALRELVLEYVQVCTSVADVSMLQPEQVSRLRAIEQQLGRTTEEVLSLAASYMMAGTTPH